MQAIGAYGRDYRSGFPRPTTPVTTHSWLMRRMVSRMRTASEVTRQALLEALEAAGGHAAVIGAADFGDQEFSVAENAGERIVELVTQYFSEVFRFERLAGIFHGILYLGKLLRDPGGFAGPVFERFLFESLLQRGSFGRARGQSLLHEALLDEMESDGPGFASALDITGRAAREQAGHGFLAVGGADHDHRGEFRERRDVRMQIGVRRGGLLAWPRGRGGGSGPATDGGGRPLFQQNHVGRGIAENAARGVRAADGSDTQARGAPLKIDACGGT